MIKRKKERDTLLRKTAEEKQNSANMMIFDISIANIL